MNAAYGAFACVLLAIVVVGVFAPGGLLNDFYNYINRRKQ